MATTKPKSLFTNIAQAPFNAWNGINPIVQMMEQATAGANAGAQVGQNPQGQQMAQPQPQPQGMNQFDGMIPPWAQQQQTDWKAKGAAMKDLLMTQAAIKRQAQNSPQDDWKAGMWASVPNSIASRSAAANGLPNGEGSKVADTRYMMQPNETPEQFGARNAGAAAYAQRHTPSTVSMPDPGMPSVAMGSDYVQGRSPFQQGGSPFDVAAQGNQFHNPAPLGMGMLPAFPQQQGMAFGLSQQPRVFPPSLNNQDRTISTRRQRLP